jgi:uncharacterized protein YoxC
MIVEIAAVFVAVAFAVLVGFLVPVLVELKRTIQESQQLLAQMNRDLPSMLKELREMSVNVNELVERTRGGMEHASGLLHAIGAVGDTVQEVHDTVRNAGGGLLMNVAGMVAGFKAAASFVKERMHRTSEAGGHANGG